MSPHWDIFVPLLFRHPPLPAACFSQRQVSFEHTLIPKITALWPGIKSEPYMYTCFYSFMLAKYSLVLHVLMTWSFCGTRIKGGPIPLLIYRKITLANSINDYRFQGLYWSCLLSQSVRDLIGFQKDSHFAKRTQFKEPHKILNTCTT